MNKLRFNALVLETLDRCNAQCAMCYQAAGPRGSELRGDHHLPLEAVLRVIDQAAELPELEGNRVHFSGGEAFIKHAEVLAAIRHARERGFQDVGAVTNAFWATDRVTAEKKCLALAEAGTTYLEVSMDHWHLPYVRLERVRTLLWASRRVGIGIILRTLSTKSHHIDALFESFTEDELLSVRILNSRVQPVGRGAWALPAEEIYPGKGVKGCCDQYLNLTVTPNGNVYPCCAGSDMTNSLACGNVLRESLAEAVLKMRTDQLIREVIHSGTGALLPIVEKLGYRDRLQKDHVSICHLCWDIFKDDEIAAALRGHFQEQQLEMLMQMLQTEVAA